MLLCFKAAATIRFDGTQHLSLFYSGKRVSEAENLSFRFHTRQKDTLLFATRDETSADRLEIVLGKPIKIKIFFCLDSNDFMIYLYFS